MKKNIFLFITFLKILSLHGQSDSLRKADISQLSRIIVNNLMPLYNELPNTTLYGLEGETVFFEINLQDNKVKDVQIWHKESRFLYDIAQKIAAKIIEDWIPAYKFPQTILLPFCVKMSSINPKRERVQGILVKDQNIYFSDEIISKIKLFETEHFLILPSPYILLSAL